MDYTRKLWSRTDQADNIGVYTDQSIYGLGVELTPNPRGLRYWERINFRAGFRYDSGNLEVSGVNIDNYNINLGLGIPLGKNNSRINLSYTYGRQGTASGILVSENYNGVNLNLTLTDFWFFKRKYD